MDPMRPQDTYPRVGDLTGTVRALADDVAVLRATCETWDGGGLRVDSGSPWSVAESLAATLDDLAAAEDALRAAVGRLEGAWSALGRLSSD
jgi:hypothetical protein